MFLCFIDRWSYTITVRRPEVRGQCVEVKTQISSRDYCTMLEQRDKHHFTIFKKRRCFLYHNQYFQLDIYKEPCHKRYPLPPILMAYFSCLYLVYFNHLISYLLLLLRCNGLILLETYTTQALEEFMAKLPDFLDIVENVTGQPNHSMYNLSLSEEWHGNKNYCFKLAGNDSKNVFFN